MRSLHSFSRTQLSGLASLLAGLACNPDTGVSDGTAGNPGVSDGTGGDTGVSDGTGWPTNSADRTTEVQARDQIPATLQQQLSVAESLKGSDLVASYPTTEPTVLTYVPSEAAGMDLIQASALALGPEELATLDKQGLVISKDETFPSFAYGYKTIYGEDLPVYVSADSLLEAVHRTFDNLLASTEEAVLVSELRALLKSLRQQIPAAGFEAQLAADLDLYLSVAQSALEGALVEPTSGAAPSEVSNLFAKLTAHTGHENVELFGVPRDVDFSQFEPRGHYTNTPGLERYFQAMMWLGRIDFRLIETQGDGSQSFSRRQFDAATALRSLFSSADEERWTLIDRVVGAFVGEHDNLTPHTLAGMLEALDVADYSEIQNLSDEAIIAELAEGGWGSQRIASRIIIRGTASEESLPLDRSFSLFGQRYTVDSHTFSNTTFDRVEGRMMPSPLDAAFAALGNNAALSPLSDELENASYVTGLTQMRTLVDAHESDYWSGSIYTTWLSALRNLSGNADAETAGVAQTDGWQRRILNAQLGSWAQLRHDTILYTKQSYTSGVSCEFPDAYVDPYPEFYQGLQAVGAKIAEVIAELPDSFQAKQVVSSWAQLFTDVTGKLGQMAENQVSGAPHSQELMAFINDAVNWDEDPLCGGTTYSNFSGWYPRLFLSEAEAIEADPVIADVHTQPTDAAGSDVGRILHVGVGWPHLMVVTAETCMGPRAYAGLAFGYGELIQENWKRMNDNEWSTFIENEPFPYPEWLDPVLAD